MLQLPGLLQNTKKSKIIFSSLVYLCFAVRTARSPLQELEEGLCSGPYLLEFMLLLSHLVNILIKTCLSIPYWIGTKLKRIFRRKGYYWKVPSIIKTFHIPSYRFVFPVDALWKAMPTSLLPPYDVFAYEPIFGCQRSRFWLGLSIFVMNYRNKSLDTIPLMSSYLRGLDHLPPCHTKSWFD